MATFEPNQPIDQAVLWKAQTTNPLHSHLPFSIAEGAHPALYLRSLLLRAGDVEVNPGPVYRGCTKTIRRDITPITCSSCSQPYHRTCSGLTRKKRELKASSAGPALDSRLQPQQSRRRWEQINNAVSAIRK